MKYQELEFKYNAEGISVESFIGFCESKDPADSEVISSFDHFYSLPGDPSCFFRHRIGETSNQLTFKRKKVADNNFQRKEINIGIDVEKDAVSELCSELGYKFNTTLFKTSYVYVFENYLLAYYVCYTPEMRELGRYIEIEAAEDYPWVSEQQAWELLYVVEKSCRKIGLTPLGRIKQSLFELFGKKDEKPPCSE